MNQLPVVGLTMGDPAGVGPELMLRALSHGDLRQLCRFVLFGDTGVLEACSRQLNLPPPPSRSVQNSGTEIRDALEQNTDEPLLVQVSNLDMGEFQPCRIHADCGRASYEYVDASISTATGGLLDAVVTGPLNKAAMNSAGIHFPGHTEIFAERAYVPGKPDRWCMMQYSDAITCAFATVHVGYGEVPKLITKQRVYDTIELTHDAMLRLRDRPPKIVVCGLNPHAGENGLFGQSEEQLAIAPAIQLATDRGINVEGPLPGDTAFLPWRRECTDAFVCMYHDQGHIPLKAIAFDEAVNTTLGLKVIRTSVDHGTAYDIAWGHCTDGRKPNDSSLLAAIRLAIRLSKLQADG